MQKRNTQCLKNYLRSIILISIVLQNKGETAFKTVFSTKKQLGNNQDFEAVVTGYWTGDLGGLFFTGNYRWISKSVIIPYAANKGLQSKEGHLKHFTYPQSDTQTLPTGC